MNNNHTFVICAYGVSVYLEDCIKSLLNQTEKTKIICYSSTPNDHINSICNKYSISFYTKSGGSIGKDWNNALSFVETDYVTIAHQDDIYLPTFTEKVLQKFKAFPNSKIVYTDYTELKNNVSIKDNINLKIKTLMLKTLNIFPESSFWQKRILAFGNPISCPAVSYNLNRLAHFSFNENLRTSLDWFAWYQISQNYSGRFSYIEDKLMYHRIHDESETSATISDNTRTKEDQYMFELLWPKMIANILISFYKKSQNTNN